LAEHEHCIQPAAARADPVGFVDRLPERLILSYTDYVNRTVWRK
jgi:hypothetical protein